MPIRVVIADDHPVVRDGLRFTIERTGGDIALVGEAADGMEAVGLARRHMADVYIIDVTMPRLNGIDAARQILKVDPKAAIIIMSLHDSAALVDEALRMGAKGYLLKIAAASDITNAIRTVHKGDVYLSPRMARHVAAALRGRGGSAVGSRSVRRLTAKERQVLQLLAEGGSSKEIAGRLGRSVHTVRVHRAAIMKKLNIHKAADLARYAVREGIAVP